MEDYDVRCTVKNNRLAGGHLCFETGQYSVGELSTHADKKLHELLTVFVSLLRFPRPTLPYSVCFLNYSENRHFCFDARVTEDEGRGVRRKEALNVKGQDEVIYIPSKVVADLIACHCHRRYTSHYSRVRFVSSQSHPRLLETLSGMDSTLCSLLSPQFTKHRSKARKRRGPTPGHPC